MSTASAADLVTVGELARRMDVAEHRIAYIITSRRIEPVMRAGILRLFPAAIIPQLQRELDAISAAKPGPVPAGT